MSLKPLFVKSHLRPVIVLTILSAIAVTAYSQSYRSRSYGRYIIPQHAPPKTELVVARWRFGTNGWFGHRGWSHNYPQSDQNLNEFIRRTTGINVDVMSYQILDLASDEILSIRLPMFQSLVKWN